MPSTYSNSLKIQLMATGENSTTWGNVANVNLGTALEEAIVGSADVTFASGPETLTLADSNATQTARNFRLNLTGTSGGAQNLIVPSKKKAYVVYNGCVDTITVKTSAGTGIPVPTTKTLWVYCDGTNVVDVVTHLSNLTLGTPLGVAAGGTGANNETTARTNLGVGTVATQNANSVTITGGTVSGITDLAVADGGTGASTAAGARTGLGLGSVSTQNANAVTITGGDITGITDLAVADGGTAASTASGARTNLGLGTMATQNASTVAIVGGSITGITDVAVADGGTGASTAAGARTNLGLAIGSDVQAYDAAAGKKTIPQSTDTTPDLTEVGEHIYTSSTVTIDAGVFSAGDSFAVVNSGTGSITITTSAVTAYLAGTSGAKTSFALAARGMASVLCVASNTFYLSGAGLS